MNHGARRRWFFGSFSVMAENRDDALNQAMALHPHLFERWRSWG